MKKRLLHATFLSISGIFLLLTCCKQDSPEDRKATAEMAMEKAKKEVKNANGKQLSQLRHKMAWYDAEIRQHRLVAGMDSSRSGGTGLGPWAGARRSGQYAADAWTRGEIQKLQKGRSQIEAQYHSRLMQLYWDQFSEEEKGCVKEHFPAYKLF